VDNYLTCDFIFFANVLLGRKPSDGGSIGISTGSIVGIVIGALMVVAIIGFLAVRRRKTRSVAITRSFGTRQASKLRLTSQLSGLSMFEEDNRGLPPSPLHLKGSNRVAMNPRFSEAGAFSPSPLSHSNPLSVHSIVPIEG